MDDSKYCFPDGNIKKLGTTALKKFILATSEEYWDAPDEGLFTPAKDVAYSSADQARDELIARNVRFSEQDQEQLAFLNWDIVNDGDVDFHDIGRVLLSTTCTVNPIFSDVKDCMCCEGDHWAGTDVDWVLPDNIVGPVHDIHILVSSILDNLHSKSKVKLTLEVLSED